MAITITSKDVGQKVKLRGRHGVFAIRALSANGKTAYVDTMPEAAVGYNFKGRFEDVAVDRILCRVKDITKGRTQAA